MNYMGMIKINWIVPALMSAIFHSAVIAVVYIFLYLREKQDFLGIWAISWVFCFFRYIFELIAWKSPSGWIDLSNFVFALTSGFLLLWGTHLFIQKKMPKEWFYALLANLLWFLWGYLWKKPFYVYTLPTFIFLGIAYIWTGVTFIKKVTVKKYSRAITGVVFILWGLHKVNYPFLKPLPKIAPWGYLLAAAFEMIAALGILISYFEKTKEDLKTSKSRYKILSDSAKDIILFIRCSDGRIIEANNAASEFYGYTVEELLELKIYDLLAPNIHRECGKVLTESIIYETLHRRKDGSIFSVEVSSARAILEGENVVLNIIRDITDRKLFEEKLTYMSMHDRLTDVYNRTFFDEKIDELDREGLCPLGVIVCDIDGLKMINDTFGHEVGDEFIKATADILKECIRPRDILARFGGDEFAIILPHSDMAIVEEISNKIREVAKKRNNIDFLVPLHISVGWAVRTDCSISIEKIIKEADSNMCREKLHHSKSIRSSIINTLVNMLEARDVITKNHSGRMVDMIMKLGKNLGLNQRRIEDLQLLATFHDIGKVGIPDSILFKDGPLTADERAEMQRHSEIGHHIALSSPELAHIADWILMHHERWDGTGYPLGVKGEDIPLECRILSVVDSYDAMIEDRPYRSALSHEEAKKELLRCSGTQFDPYIVEKFLEIIE